VTAYYNENDPKAAAWLRELIKVGAIAPGEVDERDIRDVRPSDLGGFVQCHFFAGIGVWSYALRLAGWSDQEPVWTGSCPCQPFSQAGKGEGFADERHLWPAWFHLLEERGPSVVFGEQVASPDGLAWLDLVQADLEAADYAVAAIDLCAAGIGAPHIRQRLYWVGDARREGLARRSCQSDNHGTEQPAIERAGSAICALADYPSERRREGGKDAGGFTPGDRAERLATGSVPGGYVGGFWADAEWVYCTDRKYRPVEPGTFPLAHGAPARVGRLRGYGNALVSEQAAAFISAYRGMTS
jgi:DNA (cytosine-5)-methyltransferase 1